MNQVEADTEVMKNDKTRAVPILLVAVKLLLEMQLDNNKVIALPQKGYEWRWLVAIRLLYDMVQVEDNMVTGE